MLQLSHKSKWVFLRRERIQECVKALCERPICLPDRALLATGDEGFKIAFVLTRDAINFGSGYHPYLRKLGNFSGARTITQLLFDYFDREGVFTPQTLSSISALNCADIFGQPTKGPAFELMEMFSIALREMGEFLTANFDGDWLSLIEEANGSARRLVAILSELTCWKDVVLHDGLIFPFMKRAQLAAWGLSVAVPERTRFSDLDQLTIFADNLIPHVLKLEGILVFSDTLNKRIDQGMLIEAQSSEEIEIRALAVQACEELVAAMRASGRHCSALEVSSFLWNQGQGAHYKARPRHRTQSYFY